MIQLRKLSVFFQWYFFRFISKDQVSQQPLTECTNLPINKTLDNFNNQIVFSGSRQSHLKNTSTHRFNVNGKIGNQLYSYFSPTR